MSITSTIHQEQIHARRRVWLESFPDGAGIDVVESDLGERILQLMHLEPSHIVLPAIHIKREQVGELFEKEMGTEKGNFDPTYLTHAARKEPASSLP